MRRWLVLLIAVITAVGIGVAPPAAAAGVPIGNLGETLRVEFKGIVADVTVHDVLLADPPPGYAPTGSPRWRDQGGPACESVTVHVIQAPNLFITSIAFAFDGVTPYGDAYAPKNTDAGRPPVRAAERASGGDGRRRRVLAGLPRSRHQRHPVEPADGTHLAQWNIWQPGAPLP
jgi:hypothetical protein